VTWLTGAFLNAVLNWLWGKILGAYNSWKKDKENHAKNINQAAQDSLKAKELKQDANEKQTDEAIDDELRHL
jgi:hypothetical protein